MPAVLSITEASTLIDAKGKSHIIYHVDIKVGNYHRSSHKKYSEFRLFDKIWKLMSPGVDIKLPPKIWFGNKSDSVVEDRKLCLTAYLSDLIKVKEMSPFVSKFLVVPQDIIDTLRTELNKLNGDDSNGDGAGVEPDPPIKAPVGVVVHLLDNSSNNNKSASSSSYTGSGDRGAGGQVKSSTGSNSYVQRTALDPARHKLRKNASAETSSEPQLSSTTVRQSLKHNISSESLTKMRSGPVPQKLRPNTTSESLTTSRSITANQQLRSNISSESQASSTSITANQQLRHIISSESLANLRASEHSKHNRSSKTSRSADPDQQHLKHKTFAGKSMTTPQPSYDTGGQVSRSKKNESNMDVDGHRLTDVPANIGGNRLSHKRRSNTGKESVSPLSGHIDDDEAAAVRTSPLSKLELQKSADRPPSNTQEAECNSKGESHHSLLRCVKSFTALTPGQLSLEKGEILQELRCANGWYYGQDKTGRTGYFPSSIVQRI